VRGFGHYIEFGGRVNVSANPTPAEHDAPVGLASLGLEFSFLPR